MKRKIPVLLIILLLCGCSSNNPQGNDLKSVNVEDVSPTATEIAWKEYNEVLGLLSNKYNIDSLKVKPLIIEYLKIHDPFTYLSLEFDCVDENDSTMFDYIFKPREDVNTTVKRLSQLYTIDNSTLSSFVYDFRVYDKLLKIEEGCDK